MEIRAVGPEAESGGMGIDPRMIMRPPASSATGLPSAQSSSQSRGESQGNSGVNAEGQVSTIEQNVSTVQTSERSHWACNVARLI
jgi:hypothetical protein